MPESERIPSAQYETQVAQDPPYRVLLVEDDRVDQRAFLKFVQDTQLPYDCTIVGSVSEARDVLRKSVPFDVVICDYMLGDGTAFDALPLVKDAPVILVTGAGGEETAVQAWNAGAYDYLVKDVHGDYLKVLTITVENAIRHRRTEEKLELLSAAIMSTDDCIYITDMHGKIIFVNNAFCRTYGYADAEILGKDGSILWTGGHQRVQSGCVLGIQTPGGGSAVGFYHERRDGRRFPVSLSRSIIKDANGNDMAVVGIARDISDRILLMDDLCSHITALEAQTKRRTDLTLIVVEALDSLLRRADVNKALRIVTDFREILDIEREGVPLERADVSIGSLISQVVEALGAAATEKHVEIVASVPETELVVHADQGRTARALTCILRSLIYAVPGMTCVHVRASDAGNGVAIEMNSSDAIGTIPKIRRAMDGLDPFGGHSDSRADIVLTLFLAKKLVELNGGTVGDERRSGQPDVLSLTLPKSNGSPLASHPSDCSFN